MLINSLLSESSFSMRINDGMRVMKFEFSLDEYFVDFLCSLLPDEFFYNFVDL